MMNSKSHNNGHLAFKLFDSSLRKWFAQLPNYYIGNWPKKFCMVQRRKFSTIVNIWETLICKSKTE